VIDEEGNLVGVMPPSEALAIAREREQDLIEIAPMANPPVCKIIDWSKFKYEYSKKQRSSKQHTAELKEMWFKPRTDVGDLNHKVNKIKAFLEDKHKVKITVKPSYSDRRLSKTFYFDLIAKVLAELADVAEVETPAREEGRNVYAIIKSKK
jgi:translation initiation factor IF-3